MNSKDILISHYNRKYRFKEDQLERIDRIVVHKYPVDRYEAAVYWGKGTGRALEIGAGSGKVCFSLKDQYDEYVVTEFSTERIKYLKMLFGKDSNVKIVENDIEERKLDFPPEYFDTIIMIALIEHLIEPISVIEYCYSLLKPGGKMLINTPNIAKWTRRLKLLFGYFPSTGSQGEGLNMYDRIPTDLFDEGHLHYFTFRSLDRLLKKRIGFREVKYCGHGNSFLSRILPTLFSECLVVAVK